MGKKSRLIAKLENFNADNAWTYDEAVYLLFACDYTKRGSEGSHRAFTKPGIERPVVLAEHGKKLKGGYVRMLRQELMNQ